jgi:hypothetical protein
MELMSSTKRCSSASPLDPPDARDDTTSWSEDICHPCRALFSGNYEEQTGPHHPSFKSLKQSVLEDCYICCYLWSEVRKDEDFHSDSTHSPYTEFKMKPGWHFESRNLDFTFAGSSKAVRLLLFPAPSVTSMWNMKNSVILPPNNFSRV